MRKYSCKSFIFRPKYPVYPGNFAEKIRKLYGRILVYRKKLVLINDIRFKGKWQINSDDVKQYLEGYAGDYYENAENTERIFIGSELPEEYTESESRKSLMGANAKSKANAATAILELIQTASNPAFEENVLIRYNLFHARLLIHHAENKGVKNSVSIGF